jgi:hypothetical protein
MVVQGVDTADQTLAASGISQVNFAFNTVLAGTYTPPAMNEAHYFEVLAARLVEQDGNGKLQVLRMTFNSDMGANWVPTYGQAMPFTFPAAAGIGAMAWVAAPVPLYYGSKAGSGVLANAAGPFLQFVIVNTDGAGSHTYRRLLSGLYRIIRNIDPTTGPILSPRDPQ